MQRGLQSLSLNISLYNKKTNEDMDSKFLLSHFGWVLHVGMERQSLYSVDKTDFNFPKMVRGSCWRNNVMDVTFALSLLPLLHASLSAPHAK